jgi:hypothetical protein
MEQHLGFPLETIAIFAAVVAFSVWLDLRLHKDSEDISIPNAVAWSLFWIFLAIAFFSISRSTTAPNSPICSWPAISWKNRCRWTT